MSPEFAELFINEIKTALLKNPEPVLQISKMQKRFVKPAAYPLPAEQNRAGFAYEIS